MSLITKLCLTSSLLSSGCQFLVSSALANSQCSNSINGKHDLVAYETIIQNLTDLRLTGRNGSVADASSALSDTIVYQLINKKKMELDKELGTEITARIFKEVQNRVIQKLNKDDVTSPPVQENVTKDRSSKILSTMAPITPVKLFDLPQLGDHVRSVEFSNDSRFFITTDDTNYPKIWDIKTAQLVTELRAKPKWFGMKDTAHTGRVKHATFSPDGLTVLTLGVDGQTKIWNSQNGELVHDLKTGFATFAKFSPNGEYVIAGYNSEVKYADETNGFFQGVVPVRGSLRIWNAKTGKFLFEINPHPDLGVTSAAVSPNGKTVIIASYHKIELWDLNHRSLIRTFDSATYGETHDITFSPDGFLVLATKDIGAVIWETSTGQYRNFLEATTYPLAPALMASDSRFVVNGLHNGIAEIWDAYNGQPLTSFGKNSLYPHRTSALSPEGGLFLFVPFKGVPQLWKLFDDK